MLSRKVNNAIKKIIPETDLGKLEVAIFLFFFNSESVPTHHGRDDPADVDRVVSFQVVPPSVLLVQGAHLEKVQARLQDTRLIL